MRVIRMAAALCAALWLALASVCALAQEAISLDNYLYGVLRSTDGVSDVNVRQGPSMDTALAGTYRSGVNVRAFEREGEWLRVEVGSEGSGWMRGYVLAKYFSELFSGDEEGGLPVMRLGAAQPTWDFAAYPEEIGYAAHRLESGAIKLGVEGWPQLGAGTLCVALGEAGDDGEWTHVRIGWDMSGFVKTSALEKTQWTSQTSGKLPSAGYAIAQPPTDYAMPAYRYTQDDRAVPYTLRAGEAVEYISCMGEWTQIRIANYMECAFVPTRFLQLYPFESLFVKTQPMGEGEHTVRQAGLYTFACEAGGSLGIACEAYERSYEGQGFYTMYLPVGATLSIVGGAVYPINQDAEIEDKSIDGVGAWDETQGTGRYLAGVQLIPDLWRDSTYAITVMNGKDKGYYRIENINQDAGLAAQSDWIQIGPEDVIDAYLYYGHFIELRDAKLSYFSGNG